MYSGGRFSLVCVTVFALVMTGLLLGATDALAQERSETTMSFYTGFGRNTAASNVGGPYIIGAVWDPAGDGGDGEIRIIFSEDLEVTSLEDPSAGGNPANYDFKAHGFGWLNTDYENVMPTEVELLDIPSATDQRVVALRGFSNGNPPQSGDSISLRTVAEFLADFPDSGFAVADWTGGVEGDAFNTPSLDHAVIPLREGPQLVTVMVSDDWYTTPMTDVALAALTYSLEFDCDVDLDAIPATAADSLLWKLTAEMADNGDETVDIDVTQPGDANTLQLALDAASSQSWRWPLIGQTMFILGAEAVTATDAAAVNEAQQRVFVEVTPAQAAGPVLLGATVDGNNTMWLIFNEPIDPASITANPAAQYTIAGGGGAAWDAAANQVMGFNTYFTNVIKVESALDAGVAGETIVPTGASVRNYQWNMALTDPGAQNIGDGIAIIRASYDTKGTASVADDELLLTFSETFATNPVIADLEFIPSDFDVELLAELDVTLGSSGPHGVMRLSDFDAVAGELDGVRLPIGMSVQLAAAAGVTGTTTDPAGAYVGVPVPIVEDRIDWPTTTAVEIASQSGKFYDNVSGTDEMYLTWRDAGGAEYGDEWLLFFTTQDGELNQSFINTYADDAIPLGTYHPQSYSTTHYLSAHVNIAAGETTTDGLVLVNGDSLSVMIVPGMVRGSIAPYGSAMTFATPFIVGPPCRPVDFTATKDNLIHVAATLLEAGLRSYTITGDSGAAPCGDSVLVFNDANLVLAANIIGRGAINPVDRSFGPITLTDQTPPDMVWLRAKTNLGVLSEAGGPSTTTIIVDNDGPDIAVDGGGLIVNPDRFNPYQVYTANDYINILALIYGVSPASATSRSDLLTITADFTDTDWRVVTAGGDSVNAIPFVALGADQTDNDGDWDDTSPNAGAGNGVMDFPEPYFDEDGNGYYTAGEEFIDVDGDGRCDAPRDIIGATDPAGLVYDFLLDSADPDEHGIYEIRLTADAGALPGTWEPGDADSSDVVKGFRLVDPRTDPLGAQHMGERFNVPVILRVVDATMDTTVVYNGVNAGEDPVFVCKLDEAVPTVSKITSIRRPGAIGADPDLVDNIYEETDPIYNIGRFLHIAAETPSDIDVLYGQVQIETSRSGGTAWEILSVDPPGANGDAAGYPGLAGVDDDGDGLADSADVEVLAALTDPLIDGVDNDGDAYFTFMPYYDGGANTYQRVIWHNIDEAGEQYAIASDENEDGMSGSATVPGEAVDVTINGTTVVWDSLIVGGVYQAGTIAVPAATVLGLQRGVGDDDMFATTEFTDRAYGIMDGGYVDVGTAFAWGDSTAATQALHWYDTHGSENIDWRYLAQYYDMEADGETTYRLRVVAYDQAGLANADYAYPMTFTIDLTSPDNLVITNCDDGDDETGPADFVDVDPDRAGLQIYDDALDTYTLTVENIEDAVSVLFEARYSDDGGLSWTPAVIDWTDLCDDGTQPFTCEFDAGAVPLSNDPPDQRLIYQFRAWGTDEFGNVTDSSAVCVFEVEVIDGAEPTTWFTEIWTVENALLGGAGPYAYWYRDTFGPVQVPVGPVIDLKANYDDDDVIRVVFEYRPVGSGGEWVPIETLQGNVLPDGTIVDLTRPVAVTLDTETLGTGSFDIRVYACDIEGNCNIDTADMATITILERGLRAYIEEPVGTGNARTLYAFNYIHDADINYVTFQYSEDEGTTWADIDVDESRGDVLILRGTESTYDELAGLADPDQTFNANEKYWDADEDGMYSPRDPIVWDEDGDGFWGTADGDSVILGDMTGIDDDDSVPIAGLTAALGYYHTDDVANDGLFQDGEWIFQDNGMEAVDNTLDLWSVSWDVSTYTGTYWVRAVATDEFGQTDDGSSSPIPHVIHVIDVTAPDLAITQIRYVNAGTLTTLVPGVDVLDFPGVTEWLELTATTADADIDSVLFQWSVDGGTTWTVIDLNDDNDFFADIVDNGVFDVGDEEIFKDVNGNFVYDAGTDLCLAMGDNNEIDTPDGYPLLPLVGEDPDSNGLDDDGDGLINEDDDDPRGDRDLPYQVFFLDIDFLSDTNVQFRTQAWDLEGNLGLSDVVTVLIGETVGPLTDVNTVETAAGTLVDVLQAVSDGDPVDLLGALASDLTLEIFVTASDGTEIESMDLQWRWHPDCYPDMDPWDNNWASMTDIETAGWATLDTNYDWKFTLDLAAMAAAVGDGTIEFFPMGTDGNGNTTTPPVNPYSIRFLTNRATISTTAWTDSAVVDQHVWLAADLGAVNSNATVTFMAAPRVMNEEIDASRVAESWPYRTLTLEETLYQDDPILANDHVVLSIDGVTTGFTYYEDEAALWAVTGRTKFDWTYTAASNTITFGAPPAADDVILVSYDVTGFTTLGDDTNSPYTMDWTVDDPTPGSAWDVVAIVSYGALGTPACYEVEPVISENWILNVKNATGPTVHLYMGGGYAEEPEINTYPGNSSFYTQDQVGQGTEEWKLSGVEGEVFVTLDTGTPLTAATLVLTEMASGDETSVELTEVTDVHTHVNMTFTLYESDFPQVDYGFENVVLNVDELPYGSVDETYAMAEAADGIWQVGEVALPVGATIRYTFSIDVNGDDFGTVADPRNAEGGNSQVIVPATPFFYGLLDLEAVMGTTTGVWQVSVEARDSENNLGIYPPVLFVYDPEAPAIDALTATHDRFNETVDVTLWATITDPHTFNAVTVSQVLFEYCPNYSDPATGEHEWLPVPAGNLAAGYDADRTDGWAADEFNIPDPEADDIDNDGNGLVDEEAEGTVQMAIRVFAMDDGHNYGEAVVWTFTLDSTEPAAVLTAPVSGQVFTYDSTITLTAVVTETQADLKRIMFQFDAGSGWPGAYVPGAEGWVDATPEDNSDDPWLLAEEGVDEYTVTFRIADYQEWIDEHDTYLRFRAVAVDNATNEDGDPAEVLVLMDEINSPTAWLTDIKSTGVASFRMFMDPHTAIQGDGVDIRGTVADPEDYQNIATVEIQYYNATSGWTMIDVLQPGDLVAIGADARMATFAGLNTLWDVTLLDPADYADGIRLRALATDIDGNTNEDPAEVTVELDLDAPSVSYEAIAGSYAGFTTYAEYENDGVAGDATSKVLLPNEFSEDIYFAVITPDADLSGVTLEWRYHTDGIGAWRAWPVTPAMDYEPNLTFSQGGVTYYVWRQRTANLVEAWTDAGLNGGRVDIRALALDYAGNSNYLHNADNDWEMWTVDITDPLVPAVDDWADDLTAHQVIAGGTVHLQVELRDAMPDSANTDVTAAYFEYSRDGGATWFLIEDPEGVELTPYRIDTPFAYWLAEVDWTTPTDVYWDEDMNVRVTYWDAAGNTPGAQEWATAITVEDEIMPDLTKMMLVPAETDFIDDPAGIAAAYDSDCDAGTHDALYYDVNGDGEYDDGVDVPIDFGRDLGAAYVLDDEENGDGTIGAPTNTWPRWIDENEIGGTNPLRVSNSVVLVARTQDPDTGLEYVEFWAENEATEEVLLIGVDDCTPNWADLRAAGVGPLWSMVWNTETELTQAGEQMFPDGWYKIYARAMDREGNYEELDTETEMMRIYVDNTGPVYQMDPDPLTATIEPNTTVIEVERNGELTVLAVNENEMDDDELTFEFKRSRDLNLAASWTALVTGAAGWGVDDSDVNPDLTRPYSFDWDLDKMDVPLTVGENYDVSLAASDIVGNDENDVIVHYGAGSYMTFRVVDTTAPVATISRITRVTGNTDDIWWPHEMDIVHARDLDRIQARILGLDNDVIQVDFMYAEDGSTTPVLIDGVMTSTEDGLEWTLNPNWDLRVLAGKTLWVFAVGRDDVGNVDFNQTTGRPIGAPAFKLFVDYEVPVVAIVTPVDGMKQCPFEGAGTDSVYLLQFTSTATDIDHDSVIWDIKRHEALEYVGGDAVAWDPTGVFDAATGTWTNYWDLEDVQPTTGLYDFRLTMVDMAGNEYQETVAEMVIVDADEPNVAEVTRIDVHDGEETTTIYPAPAPVEISRGELITVTATFADDEIELPTNYETGVSEVLFQGRRVGDPDWRDIGIWMAPTGTIYVEGTASVLWNTSGLDWAEDGEDIEVRVLVKDEVCNVRESGAVALRINDWKPARARIAGWYVCPVPHGDDPAMYCRVYALAYCDADIDEVRFEYMPEGGDEWITFGVATEGSGGTNGIDYLWFSDIELKETFELGDTVQFRAVATDDQENVDEAPPAVTVTVGRHETGLWAGTWDLMPMEYGAAAIGMNPHVNLIAEDGTSENAKVHVMMTDPLQNPHVLMVRPIDGSDPCCDADSVYMEREVTPGTDGSWFGWDPMDTDTCGRYEVFASALDAQGGLQIYRTSVWTYAVTAELGTRGWATVNGYMTVDDTTRTYNRAMINVPSGAGGMDCLYLSPVAPPEVDGDQARYLTMLPRTAYFFGHPGVDVTFNVGYPAEVKIEYDEGALEEIFGAEADAREPFLTVKAWGDPDGVGAATEQWHGNTISHVAVDTEANTITFSVDRFRNATLLTDPFFAVFAPRASAPVTVSSFKPGSVKYGRWNYTDADPVIIGYLNSPGPSAVRVNSIELWIDDVLWAATASGWTNSARGSGRLDVTMANEDGTIYEVVYHHSYRMEDWLTPDWHTLNIVWEDDSDQGNWYELPAEGAGARFYVDMTAPLVEFHGGFVNNPRLQNVAGYLSPTVAQNMLTVELYDAESGIYMRPDHPEWVWDDDCLDSIPPDPRHSVWQDEAIGGGAPGANGCWVAMDYGFKYDLWLVQRENDQADIDEIEERLLLHSGTADEVLPYCDPPLYLTDQSPIGAETYTPDKTLTVGLPIVGGGLIRNNDILEVVIYGVKSIEQNDDSMYVGVQIDTMYIGGQQILIYGGAHMDWRSQEMHVYNYGLIDYARNMGSKYVEQRFVVDMTAPTARLVSASPTPGQPATITVTIDDLGAGVMTTPPPTIQVIQPDGTPMEDVDFTYANGVWTAVIEDGLDYGSYTVSVTTSDLVGNRTMVALPMASQQATLSVTDAYVYPNPVNPNDFDAMVHFMLGRDSFVTVKVYDFAGDHVTTLAANRQFAAGAVDIPWDGTADGTELGNGAYLIRVEAEDGQSRKGATIKAVIWREE